MAQRFGVRYHRILRLFATKPVWPEIGNFGSYPQELGTEVLGSVANTLAGHVIQGVVSATIAGAFRLGARSK